MSNENEQDAPSRFLAPVYAALARGVPRHELQETMLAAFGKLVSEQAKITNAMGVLYGLTPVYWPGTNLQTEWYRRQNEQHEAPAATTSPFERTSDVVLEIAERASGSGRGSVRTPDIIARLRELGDTTDERALSVAVGNVLNRAGWRRVTTGVYEPPNELE